MRKVLLVTPIATLLAACTPEATSPQAGAAISRVVPVVVPDAWCSAAPVADRDSTSANDKTPPPPGCTAAQPSAPGGSVKLVVDSTLAATDTTK
jgi:hypothetical protein